MRHDMILLLTAGNHKSKHSSLLSPVDTQYTWPTFACFILVVVDPTVLTAPICQQTALWHSM